MTDPARHVVLFQVAAREVGLSTSTLRRLCKAGTGPVLLRLSERRLGIRRGDLDSWLDSRVMAADPNLTPESSGGTGIRFRERKAPVSE